MRIVSLEHLGPAAKVAVMAVAKTDCLAKAVKGMTSRSFEFEVLDLRAVGFRFAGLGFVGFDPVDSEFLKEMAVGFVGSLECRVWPEVGFAQVASRTGQVVIQWADFPEVAAGG